MWKEFVRQGIWGKDTYLHNRARGAYLAGIGIEDAHRWNLKLVLSSLYHLIGVNTWDSKRKNKNLSYYFLNVYKIKVFMLLFIVYYFKKFKISRICITVSMFKILMLLFMLLS